VEAGGGAGLGGGVFLCGDNDGSFLQAELREPAAAADERAVFSFTG
jgi:hypothetical protein